MSAYNSIISDSELRDLFRAALIEGDETEAFTETFIEMEQKMAFSADIAFVLPLHQEQELFAQLHQGLGAKIATAGKLAKAGKLGMKWIFTGLGSACVATGLVVYSNSGPENDPQPAAQPAVVSAHNPDSVAQPDQPDSILLQAPLVSTPEPVTKQYSLAPLPPLPYVPGLRTDDRIEEPEAAAGGEAIHTAFEDEPEHTLADTAFRDVKRIEITLDMTNIHITAGTEKEVILSSGTVLPGTIKQKGSLLKIISSMEDQCEDCEEVEPPILDLRIPPGIKLVLQVRNGNVTIDGVSEAECEIQNNFGDVYISDCGMKTNVVASNGQIHVDRLRGDVDATGSFSDLFLTEITGNVHGTTESGAIVADNIRGATNLKSDFGDVTLTNSQGETTLHANSGNIHADFIKAQHFNVDNSFGNVSLSDIDAQTDITSNSGNVTLNRLTGNTTILSSFGSVNANQVIGAMDLNSNSGNSVLKNTSGDLLLFSQFGNVSIFDSKGKATLAIASGNLETRNMEISDSLNVSVDFGNGKIGLKNPNEELSFDLESSFGKVKINKGSMKLEKENGAILQGEGRIRIRGTASSGNLTFN